MKRIRKQFASSIDYLIQLYLTIPFYKDYFVDGIIFVDMFNVITSRCVKFFIIKNSNGKE